jgi:hypothetical protein
MVDCNSKNSKKAKTINRPDSIGERNYLVNVGFGMKSVQSKLLFNVLFLISNISFNLIGVLLVILVLIIKQKTISDLSKIYTFFK